MENLKDLYKNLVGESQGRTLFGGSRGQVMLKWNRKKYINVQVHGLSYSAISACSAMSECSEYFNKTLSSMTSGKFLKRLKSSDSENS